MKKYVCTVCGYIYDEAAGNPESGVAPGTKWEDIPESWACPLCGATKNEFELEVAKQDASSIEVSDSLEEGHDLRKLSYGEISALFSNLAKGCEKQYRMQDSARFAELSKYYAGISQSSDKKQLSDIADLIKNDLGNGFSQGKTLAEKYLDRGALRALVWGEKVTRILSSILSRYDKQKTELLKNKNIYVCEICGFVYIGDELPEVCPVCKVPNFKMGKVQKEAI